MATPGKRQKSYAKELREEAAALRQKQAEQRAMNKRMKEEQEALKKNQGWGSYLGSKALGLGKGVFNYGSNVVGALLPGVAPAAKKAVTALTPQALVRLTCHPYETLHMSLVTQQAHLYDIGESYPNTSPWYPAVRKWVSAWDSQLRKVNRGLIKNQKFLVELIKEEGIQPQGCIDRGLLDAVTNVQNNVDPVYEAVVVQGLPDEVNAVFEPFVQEEKAPPPPVIKRTPPPIPPRPKLPTVTPQYRRSKPKSKPKVTALPSLNAYPAPPVYGPDVYGDFLPASQVEFGEAEQPQQYELSVPEPLPSYEPSEGFSAIGGAHYDSDGSYHDGSY